MKPRTYLPIGLCVAAMLSIAQTGFGQHRDQNKTFSVSKGGTLDVSLNTGDIRIRTWKEDQVKVTSSDIEDGESDNLEVRQEGNTIRIHSREGGYDNGRLEVTVPLEFNLRLRTGSGDFEIEGPLTGTISGKSGGGDVRLGNIGGQIDIATAGGNIVTGDIDGELKLTTAGGDIRMGVVSGDATVSTSGGEIKAMKVGKKLRAQTSGGNVSIGNVGGDAQVSTSGGNISVGTVDGSAKLNTAGGNVVLKGATGTVSANTAGGDLELAGITGSVTGNTAGGNITASLTPTRTGKSRLSTAGGDIRLSVPKDAKATIDAVIRIRGHWNAESERYEIRSDFPSEKYEKDDQAREIRATYALNGGGEPITLETTNGNIEIKKMQP